MSSLATRALLSLCIFFMIMEGSGSVVASSVRQEAAGDFASGTNWNVTCSGENLTLGRRPALLDNWTPIDSGPPSARRYHAMAYDSADGVVLLFSGDVGPSDTWAYNVSEGKWSLRPALPAPPQREAAEMAYDEKDGLAVLFGGNAGGEYASDTWVYDYKTDVWTERRPATAPAKRAAYAMACSNRSGQVVLFGGHDSSSYLGDTWAYNVGSNTWSQKNPPNPPSGRNHAKMVYDSATGLFVLFGGWTGSKCLGDTWTYDLSSNTWTNKNPPNSPPARYMSAMAYDSVHGATVLFGGYNGQSELRDTWTYNLSANIWTSRSPKIAPAPRHGSGMAFDRANGVSVLFGGGDQCNRGDTWLYNLTSDSWANRHSVPLQRHYTATAFDNRNGVLVLFGGRMDTCLYNDTWIYNLTRNAWEERSPVVAPSARQLQTMTYDEESGLMVLFGGDDAYGITNELWLYNVSNNTWVKRTPASPPPDRTEQAMAYDSINKLVVLFGGFWGGDYQNDTWVYNVSNDTWLEKKPVRAPSARRSPQGMVFDPAGGAMVLFGGGIQGPVTYYNDTWAYNASANTWTDRSPSISPPAREYHSIAYDSDASQVILFGGRDAGTIYQDTWMYNSSSNTWTNRKPSAPPRARYEASMFYDSASHATLLYGGEDHIDDIHIYNASRNDWRVVSAVPPARFRTAMTYDGRDGVLLLFGGYETDNQNDTWIFDFKRNAWEQRFPPVAPAPRSGHAMVYEDYSGLAIMFGGSGTGYFDDTWGYNVSTDTWTNLSPSRAPSRRSGHAMACDGRHSRVLLFGGSDGALLGDTWTYNPGTNAWLQIHPGQAPAATYNHAMAYDEAADVTVLFGGWAGDYSNETWVFNMTAGGWTNKTTADAPPSRESCAMGYDGHREGVVLFGGCTGGWTMGDTWIYNASASNWSQLNAIRAPPDRFSAAMAYADTAFSLILFGGYDAANELRNDLWRLGLESYEEAGTYTSKPFDAGGSAYFGALEWSAGLPANATLRFQFRSANTSTELNGGEFLGPDGMTGTWYEKSGQRISGVHNGTRWIQYRALLASRSPGESPSLREVTVRYNCMHSLTLSSPIGGESWTGAHSITFNGSDRDGDSLFYDIFLVNSSGGRTPLITGLPNGTGSWEWDTTDVPNGTYRILVFARDGNPSIPLVRNATSGEFAIHHPKPNAKPAVRLLSPEDGATVDASAVRLEWNGSDEDGDPLSYYVFISDRPMGEGLLPTPAAVTDATTILAQNLEDGRTYFWTVLASDGKENGTAPKARSFTVRLLVPPGPNSPPAAELLVPENNSIVSRLSVELRWNGTDGDGDPLGYFVLLSDRAFSAFAPPEPLARTGGTSLLVGNLTDGKTYFWAVIPNDGKVNGTLAGVWNFRVDISIANRPPSITSRPPVNATVGRELVYQVAAYDPDGDTVYFSLVSAPAGAAINAVTGRLAWTPAAAQKGSQTFIVRATDRRGGAGEQSFTVSVAGEDTLRPVCSITSPLPGTRIAKKVLVSGIAMDGSRPLTRVEVRIDNGSWLVATGTHNWSLQLDTTRFKNGDHRLGARAFDGTNYSEIAQITVVVRNPGPGPKGFIPGFGEGAALCAIAVSAVCRRIGKKRDAR